MAAGCGFELCRCGDSAAFSAQAQAGVWCPYLCPSAFEWQLLSRLPVLEAYFEVQWGLLDHVQDWGAFHLHDQWGMTTRLIAAPVIEELLYRGPPYLLRSHSRGIPWWAGGLLLALLFALAHGRGGVALLPPFGLGAGSLWLIARTGRFWPAVMVHFLYNFYFTSALLAGALWASD